MRAAPGFSHKPDGVRIINHYERLVSFGEIADCGEVGDVAVHREYTIARNHFEAGFAGFAEFDLEVFYVVVAVTEALGFAKADPVDDAGVVELVGDDRILR